MRQTVAVLVHQGQFLSLQFEANCTILNTRQGAVLQTAWTVRLHGRWLALWNSLNSEREMVFLFKLLDCDEVGPCCIAESRTLCHAAAGAIRTHARVGVLPGMHIFKADARVDVIEVIWIGGHRRNHSGHVASDRLDLRWIVIPCRSLNVVLERQFRLDHFVVDGTHNL